jgi:RNA polymerase sigma factor (sigma-70 family)
MLPTAVPELLAGYLPLLRRMAAGYARQTGDQEDLVQEMVIALWKALPRWRGDTALSQKAFVARVAQYTALQWLRARPPSHAGEAVLETLPCLQDRPDVRAEAGQRQAALLSAVRQLADGQRECVLLVLEGFDHGQIAAILGVAVNTVDQRLSRARARLRNQLEGS